MKKLDLTDQKYGRLTVLGAVGNMWVCRCDCGEIVIQQTGPLRSGNTKSCGCLHKDRLKYAAHKRERNPIKIGDVFGELTVIAESDVRTHNSVHWLCRCSCGKTKAVRANQLKSGDAKSCGHLSKRDLIGKTFGRLTVVKRMGDVKAGEHTKWKCKCICGKSTIVGTDSLRSGKISSCGCYRKEVVRNNIRDEGHLAYRENPEYAQRPSLLYLVEVGGVVDKIGIAFDLDERGYKGGYTKTWWTREMTRANCWAVEQVALHLTREWAPEVPYEEGKWMTGTTEQRTGWVLDDVIQQLEELCDECESNGWEAFFTRHMVHDRSSVNEEITKRSGWNSWAAAELTHKR